ncbi:hypothetical protein HMPREF9120_00391 [Neisseria sp. oral taxon 020 str. F0370]|nr:hypothetical protein HMPREF9120_00391 [Neisseria sp. oral taxon 020 str. F0370]
MTTDERGRLKPVFRRLFCCQKAGNGAAMFLCCRPHPPVGNRGRLKNLLCVLT